MTVVVIHIPNQKDWINLSDTKQSLRGYKEANKDGRYDRAIAKESKYYEFLLSELRVANDNEPTVVAA